MSWLSNKQQNTTQHTIHASQGLRDKFFFYYFKKSKCEGLTVVFYQDCHWLDHTQLQLQQKSSSSLLCLICFDVGQPFRTEKSNRSCLESPVQQNNCKPHWQVGLCCVCSYSTHGRKQQPPENFKGVKEGRKEGMNERKMAINKWKPKKKNPLFVLFWWGKRVNWRTIDWLLLSNTLGTNTIAPGCP